jgi:hypothetical protein
MARASDGVQPASAPAEALNEQIAQTGTMRIEQLRTRWRETFASDPPPAFSKDLLARAISYRLQEDALGGLSASTARLLRSLGKSGVEPPRQVKAGSVIIREHQGVVHEVLVVPGGFCWQGRTYTSLSTIAKTITGITWNGPRFFGLRSKKNVNELQSGTDTTGERSSETRSAPAKPVPRRSGRRSSLQSLSLQPGVRP